jgi:Tfp pilus assembly protein PilN
MAVGAATWSLVAPGERLNLMPPEVAAAAVRRRTTLVLAGGLALVGVGLAGASLLQRSQVDHARAVAVETRAENGAYSRDIGSLAGLSALRATIASRAGEAAAAVSGEVDWSRLQSEILAALPRGTTLTNLSFSTGSGATTSSPSSSEPGASAASGTVDMSVSGGGGEDTVAKWLRAMATVRGLQGPWVASSAAAGGTVTFTGSATLDDRAPTVVRSALATEVAK